MAKNHFLTILIAATTLICLSLLIILGLKDPVVSTLTLECDDDYQIILEKRRDVPIKYIFLKIITLGLYPGISGLHSDNTTVYIDLKKNDKIQDEWLLYYFTETAIKIPKDIENLKKDKNIIYTYPEQ